MRLAALLAALVAVVAAPAPVAAQANPIPHELAFARRKLTNDRISVSRDGNWVAFSVLAPPQASRSAARFTATGIPYFAHGNSVLITNVRSAQERDITPDNHSCWRPAFSPDSRRVAFYCGSDTTPPQLFVYDLAMRDTRRISRATVKPKLWVGDEPQWSPDGSEIFVPLAPPLTPQASPTDTPSVKSQSAISVRVQHSGAELKPTQRAFTRFYGMAHNSALGGINTTTGASRIVVPANSDPPPSVLQLSATGKWVAYLSVFNRQSLEDNRSYQDLLVVPSAGGTPKPIAAIPLAAYAPGYFTLAYSWHPTRDELFFIKDGRLWAASPDQPPRQLAAQLTDITVAPLGFTRRGTEVIVGVKPLDLLDYSDPVPRALAIVPLDGRAPIVLTLPANLVYQSLVPETAPNTLTVIARELGTVQTTVVRFDTRTAKPIVVSTSMSRIRIDPNTLIGVFEDATTPPNIYRFSPDLTPREKLSDVEPRLAKISLGPVRTFQTTVTLFDGRQETVTSALLLPPSQAVRSGKPLPTLVFQYPGSNGALSARDFGGGMPATVPASIFTTRGYAVLLVDATIGPEGKAGNPVVELAQVVLPQVRRAVQLGYADSTRLAVAGQSYGGYGTAALLTQTDVFRAAIAISGNYDLPGSFGSFGGGRWAEFGQGRMGTHPWANSAALQHYIDNSPYYQAHKITTPILLVAGARDSNNADEGRKLFAALSRLGRTAQHAEYDGEGHVVYDWSVASAADGTRRMIEFLDKYLAYPSRR